MSIPNLQEQALPAYDGMGYAQVVFTIHLQRKSLFHIVNLILPSVIVKSLAIIGFLLPPESGEKLNLEITVLLSLLVFQLVILNSMPNSSKHLPVIGARFAYN
ncbi:neuronal acetylcholine receptor subunit alpha-7 [Elysia marginata]|uniref:Neuronal acetylcholine receptor subunit alpha-7 n=1 Tax=Elysia marginata TaxID=1093978 RepID=A0AAV4I6K4_9GAST|nr:neuronal acetylcholine receptor subunit alpha-7 [Elysia marginata]